MNNRTSCLGVFVGLVVSLFTAQAVAAQTEKLGLVQYTPPKGWTKSAKEHAVVFSDINQAAGRFCFITLYSAGVSAGDPKFRQGVECASRPALGRRAEPQNRNHLRRRLDGGRGRRADRF